VVAGARSAQGIAPSIARLSASVTTSAMAGLP
jgi:hypothetical protein